MSYAHVFYTKKENVYSMCGQHFGVFHNIKWNDHLEDLSFTWLRKTGKARQLSVSSDSLLFVGEARECKMCNLEQNANCW